MKMKKMLAILAALSVLGTTGLTVGAEDMATTTEPATEAITTTETEAETTAAETTAETEAETETTVETDVTEETAATEENQVVKMEDASDEITIDGVSFTVKVSVASDSSVVLSVLKDGNVTNLNNICVESKVSGELQVGNYYSVDSNNRLTIYGVDGNHNYGWSNEYNVFVASSLREEGENLEIIDASTFQMNGKTVKITLWSYENELFDELSRISVYVDGKLTNLSGIVVNTSVLGYVSPGNIYQRSVHQYFSVSGNVLTIKPDSDYGKTASYTFDNASGQFVTAGTAPTTTTTTAAETTTTTTTTTTSEADLEAAKKALYEIYAAKYKPAVSGYETVEYHIVDGVLTSATIIVEDQDEKVVKTFFVTKDGATLINSVLMGGMLYGFESTDFTCDGYQFYAQFVKPMSDADARSYLTIYVYDNDGNLIPTNINGLQVGSAVYTRMEDGSFDWAGNFKLKLDDCLSSNGDTITINRSLYEWYGTQEDYTSTVDSTTYTYDAATNTFVTGGSTPTTPDEEMTTIEIYNNGLVTLSGTVSYEKDMTNFWHGILTLDKPVKVIYMDSMGGMVEPGTTEVIDSVQISFDRTVSIPEGAHITVTGSAMHSHTAHHLRSLVLMDCTYQLDGKTDNGSASNAPATKNTSGTPKTGDMTTVPAVAVGLTLTAAGVVAFISKRKK